MNGGSTDVGSIPLQDVGNSLWSVGWEQIHHRENILLNFDRGFVVRIRTSFTVLESFWAFNAEVVLPLVEPSSGTTEQSADIGNVLSSFKELDSLHSQVNIRRCCHGASGRWLVWLTRQSNLGTPCDKGRCSSPLRLRLRGLEQPSHCQQIAKIAQMIHRIKRSDLLAPVFDFTAQMTLSIYSLGLFVVQLFDL